MKTEVKEIKTHNHQIEIKGEDLKKLYEWFEELHISVFLAQHELLKNKDTNSLLNKLHQKLNKDIPTFLDILFLVIDQSKALICLLPGDELSKEYKEFLQTVKQNPQQAKQFSQLTNDLYNYIQLKELELEEARRAVDLFPELIKYSPSYKKIASSAIFLNSLPRNKFSAKLTSLMSTKEEKSKIRAFFILKKITIKDPLIILNKEDQEVADALYQNQAFKNEIQNLYMDINKRLNDNAKLVISSYRP